MTLKNLRDLCVQIVFVCGVFEVFGQQLQKRKLSVGVIRSKHPDPCSLNPIAPNDPRFP